MQVKGLIARCGGRALIVCRAKWGRNRPSRGGAGHHGSGVLGMHVRAGRASLNSAWPGSATLSPGHNHSLATPSQPTAVRMAGKMPRGSSPLSSTSVISQDTANLRRSRCSWFWAGWSSGGLVAAAGVSPSAVAAVSRRLGAPKRSSADSAVEVRVLGMRAGFARSLPANSCGCCGCCG